MNLVNEEFITMLGIRIARMEKEILEQQQYIEQLEEKLRESGSEWTSP